MNWSFVLWNATISAIIILTVNSIGEDFTLPMTEIMTIPIYTFIVAILFEKIKYEIEKKQK